MISKGEWLAKNKIIIKKNKGEGEGGSTHSSRHTPILDCIAIEFAHSFAVRGIAFHSTCLNSFTYLLMLSHTVLMRQWWLFHCNLLTTIVEPDSTNIRVHPFSLASFTPIRTASASSSWIHCPVTLWFTPPTNVPSEFLAITPSQPLFVRWHHAGSQLIFLCPSSGFYHPILACGLVCATVVFGSRMYSSTSFFASSTATLGLALPVQPLLWISSSILSNRSIDTTAIFLPWQHGLQLVRSFDP